MKVYLDDNILKNPQGSLLKPKFFIRRSNDNSEAAISYTGDITFTNDDYRYVYEKLVNSQDALNNSIVLKFIDDCCGNKEYIFLIKPESVTWREGECEIDANAIEYSFDANAYNCVASTLIFDNHNGFVNRAHPRIGYCLEFRPSILQDAVLIFGLLTVSMSLTLLPILIGVQLLFNTINAVITIINLLPFSDLNKISFGGDNSGKSVLLWAKDLQKTIAGFIVGCNYDHPSPLARDYINNVCQKCGLSFQSSILNNPQNQYYNMAYFSAQVRRGQTGNQFVDPFTNTSFGSGLRPYLYRNRPLHSGKSFLDEIQIPFNARWDIHDGVIRFERHDFFEQQLPWLDLTNYPKDKIIEPTEYTWTKKPRPAYANIEYGVDAMDWVGTEAKERWSDTIEWNNPVNPLQKGEFKKTFPYGAARFRGDGLDRDVLANYEWMPFGIGNVIKENKDVLLLNNGTATLPKLLILRAGTNYQKALIENNYPTFTDLIDTQRENVYPKEPYNYPLWVREGLKNNLYDRFWKIENPRSEEWSGYDFTVKIEYTCQVLNNADIDGTILLERGLAKVESIDIDFEKEIMIIKGTI